VNGYLRIVACASNSASKDYYNRKYDLAGHVHGEFAPIVEEDEWMLLEA